MTASALLSLMISAVVQAGVAVLIAFVWWLVTARGREPFLRWLGWHRPVGGNAGRLWAASLATLVGFTALMALLVPPLSGQTATSQFHGWGWVGLPAVLVYALLQTASARRPCSVAWCSSGWRSARASGPATRRRRCSSG